MVQRTKKPSGTRRKRHRKQEKANAVAQADGGPGARGAHSGESCTGTDVDTCGSIRTKRHLRMPRARWSVLSRNRKKHRLTVRELLRFLTSSRRFSSYPGKKYLGLYWGMDCGPNCGLVPRRTTSPLPKLETGILHLLTKRIYSPHRMAKVEVFKVLDVFTLHPV